MRIKYNRVSTINQSGNRFSADNEKYDLVLLDKVSGSVNFRDRPKSKELIKFVEEGIVSEIVVQDFSRLGRNTFDLINTLGYLDEKEINVFVMNLGLHSRPNGKKNPIWKMLSSVMSSMYEMERENIMERTRTGKMVYLQNGGILGRPNGTSESEIEFLKKPKSKKIIEYLSKGNTVREVSLLVGVSTKTVMKVKKISSKRSLL